MRLRGRAFLTSRVARRVFALFVVAALLPLALMALLSMTHVRGALIEQGERRLAADAKTFGSAAFGHLLDASDVARLAVDSWSEPAGGRLALQAFDSLAHLAPDGSIRLLAGQPLDLAPTPAERDRLDAGHRVLRRAHRPDGAQQVVVIVPLGSERGRGWAVAALRDDFLWGDREAWPAAVAFCVIDSGTQTPVFCPGTWSQNALRHAIGDGKQATVKGFAWNDGGTQVWSVGWGQFLHAEFGVDDWIVLATQSEEDFLRSAAAFRSVFVPAAVLTLLVVALLSLRMIRSTLTPLEQLTEATRRIAGHDFGTSVAVARADEFGELAAAFNAMAVRLGRQFKALNALAEIDREILSSHSIESVMHAVLTHMRTLVPAGTVGILLLDQDNPMLARVSVVRSACPDVIEMSRAAVTEADQALLQRNPEGAWIAPGSSAPDALQILLDHELTAAYVHPIVWRDALCGVLAFGFTRAAALDDEARKQIRELAARMAVAISSAWRDAQLYAQAHFDVLTGLPNRLLFSDRLSQHIVRSRRDGTGFALLFIDLDHFKNVNDTQGHSRGDVVLTEAGRRLVACGRASDTVARLGGDEFGILLTDLTRPREVNRVVQQMLSSLARPYVLDGQQSYLGASIGVAIFPSDGVSAEDLLRKADTAMYRAKANGRAQAVFFEERMNREAYERVALDRELRLALDRNELELHYQPQLDIATGRIVGAEALIRWHHPTRGLLLPDRFIPIAEESDLIDDIGRWVIRQVCRQDREFREQGIALKRLAANASPRELHHSDFVAFLRRTMKEHGTQPSSLEIEVTESLLVQRVAEVRSVLDQIKAAGLTIALDDFGVGFASMASLRDFPFDIIKIDKSFVAGLPDCTNSVAIVTATIAISRALGKKVIAEGVECEAHLAMLRKLGCDYAQGYHIAKPMQPAAFVAYMRANDRHTAPQTVDEPIPG